MKLILPLLLFCSTLQAQKDTTVTVTLNLNQFRALLIAIDQNIDSKKTSKEILDFLQQNAKMVIPDWNKKAEEAKKAVDNKKN